MRAKTTHDLSGEVESVLAWHENDAEAAIETLLADCRYLKEQLVYAEGLMSHGIARGWKPSYERSLRND